MEYRFLRRYSAILIAVQKRIAGSSISLLINLIGTVIEQWGEVLENKKVASLVSAKAVQIHGKEFNHGVLLFVSQINASWSQL